MPNVIIKLNYQELCAIAQLLEEIGSSVEQPWSIKMRYEPLSVFGELKPIERAALKKIRKILIIMEGTKHGKAHSQVRKD